MINTIYNRALLCYIFMYKYIMSMFYRRFFYIMISIYHDKNDIPERDVRDLKSSLSGRRRLEY